MRIPWFIRAIVQPEIELDLLNEKGKADYGKTVGMFAFGVDIILIISDNLPSLGHFIALNSVVFGWVGWRTFLKSKSATATEENLNVTRKIEQDTNITVERKGWDEEREYQES